MGRPRVAGGYNAQRAGARARRVRRLACPARKLHLGSDLWADVHGLLINKFSPEQIAVTLKAEFPGQPTLRASHESIYAAPRGALTPRRHHHRCIAVIHGRHKPI